MTPPLGGRGRLSRRDGTWRVSGVLWGSPVAFDGGRDSQRNDPYCLVLSQS